MQKRTLLILSLMPFFLLSLVSQVDAVLQTASHLLVEELVGQLEPLSTEIAYLEEDYVVFSLGREEGVRVGQLFEIYCHKTHRYNGLVRVTEVRSRDSDAEILQARRDMSSGDLADEVSKGVTAIYGFSHADGRMTEFSNLLQDSLYTAFSSYPIFSVLERKRVESYLEESNLSWQDLMEMDLLEAGLLLKADLLVIGTIIESADVVLVNARIHETLAGRMIARGSVRLSKTSFLEELLSKEISYQEEEEIVSWTTSLYHVEVKPESILLSPGESIELQVLCYDEEGFLLHELEPVWSTTGTFVTLSPHRGERVTLLAKEEGRGQVRVMVQDETRYINVQVQPSPELHGIFISPTDVELAFLESHIFRAQGIDQFGGDLDISPTWSISSGSGHLSTQEGREVEVIASGLGEIILHAQEEDYQEQVRIWSYLPMVEVPGLPFPAGLQDDDEASVEEDFLMAKTPVTYELWYFIKQWAIERGYVFANPGREGSHGSIGDAPLGMKKEPVTMVSWSDSIVWCNALSEYSGYEPLYRYDGEVIRDATDSISHNVEQEEGDGFRLPTSMEWELAARYRGSDSSFRAVEYPLGSGIYFTPGSYASGAIGPAFGEHMNVEATKRVAWYRDNTDSTREVGLKPKEGNYLGLYDMSGNIWEWCFDGTLEGRIIRGGCWMSISFYQQIGFYYTNDPRHISSVKGFRLARYL